MSEDYGFAGKRKSKNDKRKQRGYNKYKKGGQFRTREISSKKDDSSAC